MCARCILTLLLLYKDCPLSPTLLYLGIEELEQRVDDFVKQEGIEEVTIGNTIIMFLLHLNDVVVLVNTLENAKKLTNLLQNFCMHNSFQYVK